MLEKQRLRDQRDVERTFGGLAKASDSIEVNTDGLTPEEVVDRLEQIVRGISVSWPIRCTTSLAV